MPLLCSYLDFNLDRESLKQRLPRGCSIPASGWTPRLACQVVVKVKHSGFWHRHLRARQQIQLLLVDRLPSVGDSSFGMKSPLPAELFGVHQHLGNDLQNLPVYRPAFFFEGAIDNHACLYPGSLLLLRLWVTISRSPAQQFSIHLHTISISIRGVRVHKPSHFVKVLLSDVFNQKIAVNADIDSTQECGSFEVDPQLWAGIRIPETLLGVVGSCSLFGEYLLQITAEFSSGRFRTNTVCLKAT